MPQWARYAVPFALVLLAGCVTESEMARRRLQGARMLTLGSWMPVQRADFAKGDPLKTRPSTPGSQALHDAMIADESVAAFVREHGVPNAIAIVSGYAQAVDLAYVDRRTAYSLRDGEAVPGERALIDAELNLIDPDRLLASQAETLQHNIDAMARVITVGRRVLLAMPAPPAGSPPGEFYGGLWPRTSAISAHSSVMRRMPTGALSPGSIPKDRAPDNCSRATASRRSTACRWPRSNPPARSGRAP